MYSPCKHAILYIFNVPVIKLTFHLALATTHNKIWSLVGYNKEMQMTINNCNTKAKLQIIH